MRTADMDDVLAESPLPDEFASKFKDLVRFNLGRMACGK